MTESVFRTFVALITPCLFLLIWLGEKHFPGFRALWQMGFGAVNLGTIVNIHEGGSTKVRNAVLANTPQLLLTFLYFLYNGLFTYQLLGKEWNNFGDHRRGLRVTNPRGRQRSTYWLSLPHRYAIPLMLVAILLHWLYSQSIFVVFVRFINPTPQAGSSDWDEIYRYGQWIQCGWSAIAVIIALMITTVVFLIGIIFGSRRYAAGPPHVGSCSLAIAAACHREQDEDEDMVLWPLQWGVTSRGSDGVCHCTFSARRVWKPNTQDCYR